jgi:hypothetical protein
MAVINKDFVVNNGLQITEYITKVGGVAPLNGQLLIGDATNNRFSVGAIQITNGATVSQGAGTITIGTNATNNNTASTIVARDASGNFTAGNITAASFIGSGAALTGLTSSQITSALGYTPSNSTSAITITGDATGSGTNSIALTLAASGVTAGTYSAITVNAKGIVTAGGAIGSAVVTNALGYTPVNPTALTSYAPLASPAFTGTPIAPTATAGTNTTQLATTAFVTAAVAASTAGVVSFNTRTGAITLLASDVTTALNYTPANIASPAFTGSPTAPTPAQFDSSTNIATTAFVQTSLGNYQSRQVITGATTFTNASSGSWIEMAGTGPYTVTLPAPTVSNLTFTFTNVTTNSTVITLSTPSASIYNQAVAATTLTVPVGATVTMSSDTSNWTVLNFYSPSPNFAGIATASTPAQFDNSTKLATTAFVKAAGLQFTSNAGLAFTTSTTLTLAQLNGWGQFQTTGLTVTLPSLATVEKGATFTFLGSNYGGTLAGNSTDQIQNSLSAVANTLSIGIGESITLVSNTSYWYVVMDGVNSSTVSGNYAPIASPAFTGTPTAPTATAGTSTTQLATTAFTTSAISTSVSTINTSISTAVAAAKYYDVTGGASGAITASQIMTLYVSARTLNFPANFAGSQGYAVTAPTASNTFTVAVNGTTVGTIVFAASSHTATFTTSSGAFTVTPGQYMTVTAPATADTTLATVAFTLLSLAS